MVETINKSAEQNIMLLNRKLLELSGVTKVESFDSELFVLKTILGVLTITGHSLHMKHLSLDEGLVVIEGNVQSLTYSDGKSSSKNKSFIGKLFQ